MNKRLLLALILWAIDPGGNDKSKMIMKEKREAKRKDRINSKN